MIASAIIFLLIAGVGLELKHINGVKTRCLTG